MSGTALAPVEPHPLEPITGDAIFLRRKENAEMHAYLLERGAIYEKQTRSPSGNLVVKQIIKFSGLSDWFHIAGGVKAGCGPMVGAPETKAVRCVDSGCRDATPNQAGCIATAVAVRKLSDGREAIYSRSAHACPHTCESFSRDYLFTMSETRALSLTFRVALGIENATHEEIGPENPAARAAVMAERWEDVPATAECWKFFDGGGNAKAAPFSYRWKKDGNGRFKLSRRVDEGAQLHPDLPEGCSFHGIPSKNPPVEICAWIREGRGMNDAEVMAEIVRESEGLKIPDEEFVSMVQGFDPACNSLAELSLENKFVLFRQLCAMREAKYSRKRKR